METASALSLLAVQAVFYKFDLALCRIEVPRNIYIIFNELVKNHDILGTEV